VSKEAKKTIPGALALFDVKIHLTPAPARFKMTDSESLGGDWFSDRITSGSCNWSCKKTKDFVSCKQKRAAADNAAILQPIAKVTWKEVA
jgi:hypothetical protein